MSKDRRLTDAQRDLVRSEMGLARRIAGVHAQRHQALTYDDCLSPAYEGLVRGARDYDPTKGVPFVGYVRHRIVGAVLDDIRDRDWAPRLVRSRARVLSTARALLTQRLGRTPTRTEVSEETGLTVGNVDDNDRDVAAARTSSLDAFIDADAFTTDRAAPSPEAVLKRRWVTDELDAAIRALPERSRYIIVESFLRRRTAADIVAERGTTESAVSQARSFAVQKLRRLLANAPPTKQARSKQ